MSIIEFFGGILFNVVLIVVGLYYIIKERREEKSYQAYRERLRMQSGCRTCRFILRKSPAEDPRKSGKRLVIRRVRKAGDSPR